ncbi:MAG: hypothetical protein GX970_13665 [Phyllobacteriaceae bacterium]|nr:hypothetical protein [Phyllobacteriaceae bacterium]
MKRALIGAVLPLFLASILPAAAQTGAQCAAIDSDTERLACYDGVFRNGAQTVSSERLILQSEQLIPARPNGRAPATIAVSCEAGNLQVAFGFAGNMMSALGNDARITLQNDLLQARSSTLPVNSTNTEILIDNTRDARAFIDGLVGARNLTVRVTPASTRSLNVRFDVSSFGDQVAPIVANCE